MPNNAGMPDELPRLKTLAFLLQEEGLLAEREGLAQWDRGGKHWVEAEYRRLRTTPLHAKIAVALGQSLLQVSLNGTVTRVYCIALKRICIC